MWFALKVSKCQFSSGLQDSVLLQFFINSEAKGAKTSVIEWASSLNKGFFENIFCFFVNSSLSKIRLSHTFELYWMFYFERICSRYSLSNFEIMQHQLQHVHRYKVIQWYYDINIENTQHMSSEFRSIRIYTLLFQGLRLNEASKGKVHSQWKDKSSRV